MPVFEKYNERYFFEDWEIEPTSIKNCNREKFYTVFYKNEKRTTTSTLFKAKEYIFCVASEMLITQYKEAYFKTNGRKISGEIKYRLGWFDWINPPQRAQSFRWKTFKEITEALEKKAST